MAKLTEKERSGFEEILRKDLVAINQKFMNQIKDYWNLSRTEVLKLRGWDKLIKEKHEAQEKIAKLKQRINEIENKMNSEDLLPEQIVELGGEPNEYGRYKGAKFYGIPVTSQFEYDIVEYIRDRINLDIPSKILRDICEASLRELTMAGTFDEAREAYQKFYSLDFRKYGVDIPPRLKEVVENKKMLEFAQKSLQLGEPKNDSK
jgi:hypothetical protein